MNQKNSATRDLAGHEWLSQWIYYPLNRRFPQEKHAAVDQALLFIADESSPLPDRTGAAG
jgi:hypothetical protein